MRFVNISRITIDFKMDVINIQTKLNQKLHRDLVPGMTAATITATEVTLTTMFALPIAGFHCHAIKIKIKTHSLNEVKKLTRYRP